MKIETSDDVDRAIPFSAPVSMEFMGVIMKRCAAYWNASQPLTLPQLEALRRACALIEEVLTSGVPDRPGGA